MDRVRAEATSLMASNPDAVIATGGRVIPILMQLSRSIPIVVASASDPVGVGWVESLARPGGNITGITNMAAILTGKRLQLLKETIPTVSRIAVLPDPQAPGSVPQWQASQLLARELGLELYSMEIEKSQNHRARCRRNTSAKRYLAVPFPKR